MLVDGDTNGKLYNHPSPVDPALARLSRRWRSSSAKSGDVTIGRALWLRLLVGRACRFCRALFVVRRPLPWGASDSVNRRGAARRSGVRVRAAALPPSEHSCTRAAPPCLTTQHLPRLRLSAQQPSYALSLCIGTSVSERCDATQQACRLPGASPCRCCRPNLRQHSRPH